MFARLENWLSAPKVAWYIIRNCVLYNALYFFYNSEKWNDLYKVIQLKKFDKIKDFMNYFTEIIGNLVSVICNFHDFQGFT